MFASNSMHDEYFIEHPESDAGLSTSMARNPAAYSYLPFGGLLLRPPPEGLSVLLGPFSRCANMVFLLKRSSAFEIYARPEAYHALNGFKVR
jgi:hypothetical protein